MGQPCPTPGWANFSEEEKLAFWKGLDDFEKMRLICAGLHCSFLPEGNPWENGSDDGDDTYVCTGCRAKGVTHDFKCNCDVGPLPCPTLQLWIAEGLPLDWPESLKTFVKTCYNRGISAKEVSKLINRITQEGLLHS